MTGAALVIGGLSLTTAPWSVLQQGTSFPPPPLKRQTVGSLYRDGEEIVAAAFSNRVITLRVCLQVPAAPGSAGGYIAALDTILDQARSTLAYTPHPDASALTFNTWRAPDYEPELQEWGLGIHILVLTIPAEPLAVS